jgi:hypothetical protein
VGAVESVHMRSKDSLAADYFLVNSAGKNERLAHLYDTPKGLAIKQRTPAWRDARK